MTTDQEPLMTGQETYAYIGKQLHVHPTTARRYVRETYRGKLLPVGLPGLRYNPADVRAFVDHIRATSKATG